MSAASLRALGGAGVVDQDVDAPERGERARHRGPVGDVEAGAGRVDAVALGDGVALRRQLREIAAEQGEAGAVMGEGIGDRGADTAAAAGDRRVKPGEWPRTRIPQHRVLG